MTPLLLLADGTLGDAQGTQSSRGGNEKSWKTGYTGRSGEARKEH